MKKEHKEKIHLIYLSALIFIIGFNSIFTDTSSGQFLIGKTAIKGYDPVAYFTQKKAVKGDKANSFEWLGVSWYFTSRENRDMFAKTPEKYAPQYGGFCAWTMTAGKKSEANPEIWKVVNGKLYLLCSEEAFILWATDIPGNIQRADEAWKNLSI